LGGREQLAAGHVVHQSGGDRPRRIRRRSGCPTRASRHSRPSRRWRIGPHPAARTRGLGQVDAGAVARPERRRTGVRPRLAGLEQDACVLLRLRSSPPPRPAPPEDFLRASGVPLSAAPDGWSPCLAGTGAGAGGTAWTRCRAGLRTERRPGEGTCRSLPARTLRVTNPPRPSRGLAGQQGFVAIVAAMGQEESGRS